MHIKNNRILVQAINTKIQFCILNFDSVIIWKRYEQNMLLIYDHVPQAIIKKQRMMVCYVKKKNKMVINYVSYIPCLKNNVRSIL